MPHNPSPSNEKSSLKRFSYLLSIIFFFVIPTITFTKIIWKHLPKKPFFSSFFVIGMLGWIWSWNVTSRGWWSFGENFLLGFEVLPDLPIEEVLFYPFGGILCVLMYVAGSRWKTWVNPTVYWIFLIAGSAGFGALAWIYRDVGPYYLYSQLFLYNGLCSLLLAPWLARRINLIGLAMPIAALTIVGILWDYVGFTYGWWVYHAICGIYISVIPIEDFNFFLFAPTAGVSVYVLMCLVFKTPQVENGRP